MPSWRSGLGKQGDYLNPWRAHHKKGGFGFSGKCRLTLGPAVQQKKVHGWALELELDLNPTAIFISCGTLWKWLNLPKIRYKTILSTTTVWLTQLVSWPIFILLFSFFPHFVPACTPRSYASRWDPNWFKPIMVISIPLVINLNELWEEISGSF